MNAKAVLDWPEVAPAAIHKREFAKLIGVSVAVVEGWIRRDWTKGTHYVVRGHQTFIVLGEYNQWIKSCPPGSADQDQDCGSGSGKTAGSSTRKPANVCLCCPAPMVFKAPAARTGHRLSFVAKLAAKHGWPAIAQRRPEDYPAATP